MKVQPIKRIIELSERPLGRLITSSTLWIIVVGEDWWQLDLKISPFERYGYRLWGRPLTDSEVESLIVTCKTKHLYEARRI